MTRIEPEITDGTSRVSEAFQKKDTGILAPGFDKAVQFAEKHGFLAAIRRHAEYITPNHYDFYQDVDGATSGLPYDINNDRISRTFTLGAWHKTSEPQNIHTYVEVQQ